MFNLLIIFRQQFPVLSQVRVMTGKALTRFFVGLFIFDFRHHFSLFMARVANLPGCFKQHIRDLTLVRVVARHAISLCRNGMQPQPFGKDLGRRLIDMALYA